MIYKLNNVPISSYGAYPVLSSEKLALSGIFDCPKRKSPTERNWGTSIEPWVDEQDIILEGIELSMDIAIPTASINQLKEEVLGCTDLDILSESKNYLPNSNFTQYTTNNNIGWNNSLNGVIVCSLWGSGYNGGIPSPSIGYHGHFDLSKFGYPVYALIDRNTQFGQAHRWQALVAYINPSDSYYIFKKSQIITLSFDVYSDTQNSFFNCGIYHKQVGSSSMDFFGLIKGSDAITPAEVNRWVRRKIKFTTESNFDITQSVGIYVYGMNSPVECSQYIRNIQLIEGSDDFDYMPAPEDQYFNQQVICKSECQVVEKKAYSILSARFWKELPTLPELVLIASNSGDIRIDGFNLYKDFGVVEAKHSDLYSIPKRIDIGTTEPYPVVEYRESKELSFDLFMKGDSFYDLYFKMQQFQSLLLSPGMRSLYYYGKSFSCYFKAGFKASYVAKNVLKFTLKLSTND